ncbi:nucleotidyltransferase family protein, partial [bacterium LRH843]|nr:nucleotidyltransferase family protein [bacterium LRH843]
GDWKWRHHHVTYFHPIKRIKLEIHWRLNPGPSSEPQFKELWSRKRLSTVTSSPVYFLGQEDLTVFLISHGARHGWSRLRWLADIHQILNQDIEWKLV